MTLTRRFVLLLLAVCVVPGSVARGLDDCAPAPGETLYGATVVMSPTGTGATAATFETRVGGSGVRYVMYIRCQARRPAEGVGHCPRCVSSLKITLNGTVVLDTPDGCLREGREVTLNLVGGPANTIDITASGLPGATARIWVASIPTAGGGPACNAPPVAKAGPDRTVPPGALVPLDGSASTDPEGMPLLFSWSLTSRPAGSTAELSDAAGAQPTFVADVPGAYVVELVVSDGVQAGAPDVVVVTAQVGAAEFQQSVNAVQGGTVAAGGATFAVPPGSLGQDTTITLVTSDPLASLPDFSSVTGRIYDFGPNGTTFDPPARLTLPLVGTPGEGQQAVISFLDDATGQWVDLTSTVTDGQVSAPVSHFTAHAVRFTPLELKLIYRNWIFKKITQPHPVDMDVELVERDDDCDPAPGSADPCVGVVDGVVSDSYDFGPIAVIPPGSKQNATAEVFSNATGRTYWASAQAPRDSTVHPDAIGSSAVLYQDQYFRKHEDNARLTVVVTVATMDAIDLDGHDATVAECSWLTPQMDVNVACRRVMWGSVHFSLDANGFFQNSGTFFKTGGSAEINGWEGNWGKDAWTDAGATVPFWTPGSFVLEEDVDGPDSQHARVRLLSPIVIEVPLDSIGDEEMFRISALAQATAINQRIEHEGRGSYVAAFLREPMEIGGVTFSYEGLEPIAGPAGAPPPEPPGPAPACPTGPDPAAGTLQFAAAADAAPEIPGRSATIRVLRSGGSHGAVSAKLTSGGGSAIGGVDYTPVTTHVLFADGEEGSRVVEVPILTDTIAEPDKTLDLALSEPGGCATLGTQTSTVLTILDDDRPPVVVSYTIGGTVSGVVGTGLVLRNLGADDLIPGNGPFTFSIPAASGAPYSVTVASQPTNPNQVCTVSNGSGTVDDADVTNVTVDCVTLPANGALDPGFGSGGKVTGLLGGATAMALQADGKIVVLGGRTLARYDTAGHLDPTFGTGGAVTVVFNGGVLDQAQGLAVQADDRIVVVGFTRVGTSDDFAVARYDANGGLDPTFGTGGRLSTDFHNSVDKAWAVLIQADGKIVVAGHAAASTPFGTENDFALARYTATGELDPGFGTGGKVTTNVGGRTDLATAAALQPDGRILVTGRVGNDGGQADVGLVRYDGNGHPDAGFGSGGVVQTNLASFPSEIALQPDGKILVSVRALAGVSTVFGVIRFGAGGAPDGGFGSAGLATAGFSAQNDYAKSVAVQADGKVVVAGQSSNLASSDFAIARFDAGGTLDAAFGTGGKLTVDFFGGSDGAEAVAIQADGKIVIAGLARNGASNNFGLARIMP